MEMEDKVGDISLVVYANDVDESRDFYCEVLDFEIDIDSWNDLGPRVAPSRRTVLRLKSNPSFTLNLLQSTLGTAAPEGSSVKADPKWRIMVADCSAIKQRAASYRGHDAVVNQGSLPYAEYVTLQDPSGNMMQAMEAIHSL